MRTILLATDFSTRSDRALRRAVLLARQLGAELLLVHVIDPDRPARLVEAERREAHALLAELADTLCGSDRIGCRFELRTGEPFEGVLAAAADAGAELIVLGPPRRQLLRGVLTGTTAERVIRAGALPVLVANGVPAAPYRRVLLATDLSQGARAAAEATIRLGLDRLGTLAAVHVYPTATPTLLLRTPVTASEALPLRAREQREAAAGLARFLADAGLARARRLVLAGERPIADLLLDVATRLRADLLVLATRGKKGLGKLLLGSVADELLRSAELDLLAVPPGGEPIEPEAGTSPPGGSAA
ncbi:MAG: universal stress protein [Geminicoccaceae bacterium]|nr:universal stress protein [Geminicoccaceae bacterium]MCX8100970.1 universal stress protein [Geminicoccaceae bacterium]MDW8370786.1 universal stress protein [Geminicoccaceae bacterium]